MSDFLTAQSRLPPSGHPNTEVWGKLLTAPWIRQPAALWQHNDLCHHALFFLSFSLMALEFVINHADVCGINEFAVHRSTPIAFNPRHLKSYLNPERINYPRVPKTAREWHAAAPRHVFEFRFSLLCTLSLYFFPQFFRYALLATLLLNWIRILNLRRVRSEPLSHERTPSDSFVNIWKICFVL